MRKILLLVAFTLVLSIVFSSAAIARQSNGVVFYGNSQSGSVSFGDHGYAWNHSDPDNGPNISIVDRWRSYFYSNIDKYYCNKKNDDCKDWNIKHNFKWLYDRSGERCYYVDDNGVSHYFYLDPNREYEVHAYKDKNDATQYYFKATGWK
ncbi:MAG: hypothetical protein PHY77_00155 [Desulfotomaculaceae bacterium]|nr:hypothetical protein [Desulfotomaculaceae bacterium]